MKNSIALGTLTSALLSAAGPVLDNDQVRVLDVTNAPGQHSQMHKHDVNRVMIHLDAGHMRLTYENGHARDIRFKAGEVRWDPAGGMHTSRNAGGTPYRIIELELKKPHGSPVVWPAIDPLKAAPNRYTLLFDNDQVRVVRVKFPKDGGAPLHEHTRPRLLVNLTAQKIQFTTKEGAKNVVEAPAGFVRWTPAPGVHSEKNLGDGPFEAILIDFKTN